MSDKSSNDVVSRLIQAAESVVEDEKRRTSDESWWTAPYRRLQKAIVDAKSSRVEAADPLSEADEVQIGRSQAELAVLKKDGRSYGVRRIAGQALEIITRLKVTRSSVETSTAWRGYCQCKWDDACSRVIEIHPGCRLHVRPADETKAEPYNFAVECGGCKRGFLLRLQRGSYVYSVACVCGAVTNVDYSHRLPVEPTAYLCPNCANAGCTDCQPATRNLGPEAPGGVGVIDLAARSPDQLCKRCRHSYGQHTKGPVTADYCRHCACPAFVPYSPEKASERRAETVSNDARPEDPVPPCAHPLAWRRYDGAGKPYCEKCGASENGDGDAKI